MENQFLTIYRKDYKERKRKDFHRHFIDQQFKDPIAEGFRNYLALRDKVAGLSKHEEYSGTYLEKFREVYPKLGVKYFETPLHPPTIERDFAMDGQTIYQVDYCDFEKDRAIAEELKWKQEINLPTDIELPLTTSSASYRDPSLLNQDALAKVPGIRQVATLGTSKKVSQILQTKTGSSEYQATIGQLGDVIILDEMHGVMKHPKCACAKHNLKK